jgi:hypothetical protein
MIDIDSMDHINCEATVREREQFESILRHYIAFMNLPGHEEVRLASLCLAGDILLLKFRVFRSLDFQT